MLLQTLIIVFLSSWLVEEYLNNIYLQAYINETVQANSAVIAISVIVGIVGIALGLFKHLKSTHKQIGELVSQHEAEPLSPTSPPFVAATSKPSVDLHPMVAALKADLAQHGQMAPLPPLEAKDTPMPPPMPSAPTLAPMRSVTNMPSTVITGGMPVLKRANPNQDKDKQSQ